MEQTFDLRLRELGIFSALARHRSTERAAEMLGVSNAVVIAGRTRLEDLLGSKLFAEGEGGALELTASGRRYRPIVEVILERAQSLKIEDSQTAREWLTMAAPSFIGEVLFPSLARDPSLASSAEARAIRALVVPQFAMSKHAEASLFDAAITVGAELSLPPLWSSAQVGEVTYGLFASPSLARALGPSPRTEEVLRQRFIAPIYVARSGELVPGDDRCPIPLASRRVSHEVESIRLACRMAVETDDLVYGPVLAAATFVNAGALVHVDVPGWTVGESVYLACDKATVRTATQEALAITIRNVLGATARQSGIINVSGRESASARAGAAG